MNTEISIASLAVNPIWVGWQLVTRGDGKPTKVPYAPDGRKAEADDPSTWGTRAEAEACAARLPKPCGLGGIGIEFCEHDERYSIGGIDLDTCRSSDGAIEPWAAEVIARFSTYAEVSPSGTGVKLFFSYETDTLPTLRAAMGPARHSKLWKREAGDHPAAIELHLSNRYFAVTEQHLAGTPSDIRTIGTDTLLWLLKDAGPNFGKKDTDKEAKGSSTDKSRSAAAFRLGCKLHRQGKTFDEMREALRSDPATADWCREKGDANDQRELHRLWQKACDAAALADANLTEDGLASTFANRHRDELRYCHSTGSWYQWNGQIWRREETSLAFHWCRHVCRDAVARINNDKVKAIVSRASTAAAVERFARADRAFAVTVDTWDQDPFLLGTPGGTVDLRTGKLRPAAQDDYITMSTSVAPSEHADCPLWLKFLHDATRGDKEFIRFLQQWAGYCLSGDTREHALLFVFGPGGNGKTVLLNTISRILGDYAKSAPMETFTASQNDRHPTDLAMLRGARLVCVAETEEGRPWAENRIKLLTGGEHKISARFMRQDFFEYMPQFKLIVIGNHKPSVRNVDDAVRRRFNLAPFVHKPTAPDRTLEERLAAEHPAILRWAIDGILDWQTNGLVRPKVVQVATAEYFADQDIVRQWIEECCETSEHVADTFASLFASWRNYAKARSEEEGSSKGFSARLTNCGFKPIKDSAGIRGRGFRGICVRVHYEPHGAQE